MTHRSHQPLRLATLLTAGALSLLGLGLTVGAAESMTDPSGGQVLGSSIQSDAQDELAFTSQSPTEADLFLSKINDLRRSRGADPLNIDAELEITATAWAATMSQSGNLEHADDLSLGVSADWRKLGENVGVAPEEQVDELFEAFVASPTHLANLVDPSFDLVGLGIVHVDGKLWMTQRFMDVSPREAGVRLGTGSVESP